MMRYDHGPATSCRSGARPPGPLGNLINGAEIISPGGALIDVIDPATGQKIGEVSSAGEHELDRAVAAARTAFDDGRCRALSPAAKEQRLHRLASLIENNATLFAQLDVVDNGMPGALAQGFVAAAAEMGHYYAGWPTKIEGRLNPVADGPFSYTTGTRSASVPASLHGTGRSSSRRRRSFPRSRSAIRSCSSQRSRRRCRRPCSAASAAKQASPTA